ncbi:MAG: rod shape-determining protein MreC [Patescibacteria group bacterium]
MARKELRYSFVLALLAAFLWAVAFFDLPRTHVFSAAAGVLEKTGITKIPEALKKFGADRLIAENNKLSARVAFLEARIREVESGRASLPNDTAKTAVVVSIPPQSPYDIIVIGRGEQDGIRKGEKVFAGQALLGFVDEIGRHHAKVKLISYPKLATEAFLEPHSLNVTLEGYGGLNMVFMAPQDLEIKIGDRVISNTSPAYLIGEVGYIKSKESEPLQTVYIRPPVNLRHLRSVEIRP